MEVHHRLAGVDVVGMAAFVEEVFCLPEEGEEAGEFRDVPEGEFPSGQ
jgi:hypothetical protein